MELILDERFVSQPVKPVKPIEPIAGLLINFLTI